MGVGYLDAQASDDDQVADARDLDTLHEAIQTIRAQGFRKFLVCEQHNGLRNLETVGAVLQGAIADNKRVSLHREYAVSEGCEPKRYEKHVQDSLRAASKEGRYQLAADFELHWTWDAHGSKNIPVDAIASNEFRSALASGRVTPYFLLFREPGRNDLQRFAKSRVVAIGWMGMAHCMARLDPSGSNRLEPDFGEMPVSMQSPPLTKAQSAQRFDGFRRAHEAAPALVVMNSDVWTEISRDEFIKIFGKEGVFMEVPLTRGGNVTLFTTGEFLPNFMDFAASHAGKARVICDGWPGCPSAAPAPHDEI